MSDQLVYDGSRLLAEEPNRLFIDAPNTQHWRETFFAYSIAQMMAIKTETDYYVIKSKYGIRRTHPDSWYYSDLLHTIAKQYKGIEFGLFDYNRLENR